MHSQERIQKALSAVSDRDEDRAAQVLRAIGDKYGIEFVDHGYTRATVPCLLIDTTWYADDGNAEIQTSATNADDARAEYVADGDWGDKNETSWVEVSAYQKAIDIYGDTVEVNRESGSVEIAPTVPECFGGHDHEWESPFGIVGGNKENPGVWGHGGGVIIHEVCLHCGCGKTTDTWATDPTDGQQGLVAVSYEEGEYADAIGDVYGFLPWDLDGVMVTVADSVAAGNCRRETLAFARELRAKIGRVRAIDAAQLWSMRHDRYAAAAIANAVAAS